MYTSVSNYLANARQLGAEEAAARLSCGSSAGNSSRKVTRTRFRFVAKDWQLLTFRFSRDLESDRDDSSSSSDTKPSPCICLGLDM